MKAGDNFRGEGIVETRVEALMENLAVAVMQADNLAAESRDYEVLAETLLTRSILRSWVCQPSRARSICRRHRSLSDLKSTATTAVARARTREPLPRF